MYGFAMPNVDNGAHIGGFLAGAMFAYLFGPRLSVVTKWVAIKCKILILKSFWIPSSVCQIEVQINGSVRVTFSNEYFNHLIKIKRSNK